MSDLEKYGWPDRRTPMHPAWTREGRAERVDRRRHDELARQADYAIARVHAEAMVEAAEVAGDAIVDTAIMLGAMHMHKTGKALAGGDPADMHIVGTCVQTFMDTQRIKRMRRAWDS